MHFEAQCEYRIAYVKCLKQIYGCFLQDSLQKYLQIVFKRQVNVHNNYIMHNVVDYKEPLQNL